LESKALALAGLPLVLLLFKKGHQENLSNQFDNMALKKLPKQQALDSRRLPKLKFWILPTKECVISMKNLLILILLLSAWNCSADVTSSSQTVENDASNFPPVENDASNFPRFENGAGHFSPPAGADNFSPFENGAFNFPSPEKGGLGDISEVNC